MRSMLYCQWNAIWCSIEITSLLDGPWGPSQAHLIVRNHHFVLKDMTEILSQLAFNPSYSVSTIRFEIIKNFKIRNLNDTDMQIPLPRPFINS
ncbi:hypothetical protein HW555_004845 [Spodoptera exigua]|uniref:Uncharacterized protein n=1 Tax=Spodoptera exigua TaxID=7107 RepID=A0A835L754_SPOEX|nr:hypothetical protein HW555_004845 [Spodoptera exigua]